MGIAMAVRYTSRKDPIDNQVPLPDTEKAVIFAATTPASQDILFRQERNLVLGLGLQSIQRCRSRARIRPRMC